MHVLGVLICPSVVPFLYPVESPDLGMLLMSRPLTFKPTLSPGLALPHSPDLGMLMLSRPLMFKPALSPGSALSTLRWCLSTVTAFPPRGLGEESCSSESPGACLAIVPCTSACCWLKVAAMRCVTHMAAVSLQRTCVTVAPTRTVRNDLVIGQTRGP